MHTFSISLFHSSRSTVSLLQPCTCIVYRQLEWFPAFASVEPTGAESFCKKLVCCAESMHIYE